MDFQISCFPCAVATLLHVIDRGVKEFRFRRSMIADAVTGWTCFHYNVDLTKTLRKKHNIATKFTLSDRDCESDFFFDAIHCEYYSGFPKSLLVKMSLRNLFV